MSGEHDLATLLANMRPTLAAPIYVFVTTTERLNEDDLAPIMRFEEAEGTTLIVRRETAIAHNLPHEFPCRMITLNVHSALDAVGFLAVVATRLAELGMGVNPVAGFHHDHLFIPAERADDAMAALDAMVMQNRTATQSGS